MKLSPNTLAILKNFALINKGIVLKPGSTLRTIHEMNAVFAEATIEEEIPAEVAIHDLNNWLNVVSMFNAPEFEFAPEHMLITDANSKLSGTYAWAGLGMVKTPPEKKIKMAQNTIEFTLSEENVNSLMKAITVLDKPEIVIVSDGSDVTISTENLKEPHGNIITLHVDAVTNGAKCRMIIQKDYMKLLKGNYDVSVSKGVVRFVNTSGVPLTYWMAPEPTSKYEE